MKRAIAKLAFVHSRLWQRDGTYRAAVLLGPPPLLGCMVAAALWTGLHALGLPPANASRVPPWAHPNGRGTAASSGQPLVEKPISALPSLGADGKLSGLATGWQGLIQPIQISPALDVDVLRRSVAKFTLDQAGVDMAQIAAAGPPVGLYVGVQTALLAVRTAGAYGLSIRLQRSSLEPANCLTRLGLAGHRLISVLNVNLVGPVSRSYDPVEFELRPGLYELAAAFGCWHDGQVIGPGDLTVLIRHPGEQSLLPARSDEILRPLLTPR